MRSLESTESGLVCCPCFIQILKSFVLQVFHKQREMSLSYLATTGLLPVLRPTASKNECPTGSHLVTKMTACRSLLCWTGALSLVWADCSIALSSIPCCCGKSISICDACDLCSSHKYSKLTWRKSWREAGRLNSQGHVFCFIHHWGNVATGHISKLMQSTHLR